MIHRNDAAARVLFDANIRLAYHIALTFRRRAQAVHMPYEEVEQEALTALWRACRSFDPNRGAQFSTYACTCCRRNVHRAINTWEGERRLSLQSLDRDGDSYADAMLADPRTLPEPRDDRPELPNLASVFRWLPTRYREVLSDRYGLRTGKEATFPEMAQRLGVTRQRAHQMQGEAFTILRKRFAAFVDLARPLRQRLQASA